MVYPVKWLRCIKERRVDVAVPVQSRVSIFQNCKQMPFSRTTPQESKLLLRQDVILKAEVNKLVIHKALQNLCCAAQ